MTDPRTDRRFGGQKFQPKTFVIVPQRAPVTFNTEKGKVGGNDTAESSPRSKQDETLGQDYFLLVVVFPRLTESAISVTSLPFDDEQLSPRSPSPSELWPGFRK